jgi:hypothetical protein
MIGRKVKLKTARHYSNFPHYLALERINYKNFIDVYEYDEYLDAFRFSEYGGWFDASYFVIFGYTPKKETVLCRLP